MDSFICGSLHIPPREQQVGEMKTTTTSIFLSQKIQKNSEREARISFIWVPRRLTELNILGDLVRAHHATLPNMVDDHIL
jgi:hypothetical protein